MKLTEENLEKHKLPTGQYGFSATKLDALGASEYTLVTIVGDRSGSTELFRTEMEDCIKTVIKACKFSERADNLLVRLTTFSTKSAASDPKEEIHGFKLLDTCNVDDYTGCMPPGGNTALYEASENAISATMAYGKKLIADEFSANGIVFIITDGDDNKHDKALQAKHVGEALKEAVQKESLESLIVVLIGVNINSPHYSQRLKEFRDEAGLTQYVELANATPKTLAKLADFISKSISSQSKALGSGSASMPLAAPTI
jgi:hypothetical protein